MYCIMLNESNLLERINRIQKQFSCCYPLDYIQFHGIPCWDIVEVQDEILKKTVQNPIIQQYPIDIRYQIGFLKRILNILEAHYEDAIVSDGIYVELGRLMALPVPSSYHYYKHFLNSTIILKTDSNLICNGTTGLHTWPASLVLSEWIALNRTRFNDQVVLELGSGTGLVGLTLYRLGKPKKIYLTDCHPNVLNTLKANIQQNTDLNTNRIEVHDLRWGTSNCHHQAFDEIDIVLGADIIFDQDLFPSLIQSIRELFSTKFNAQIMFLACVQRNPETLNQFLSLIGQHCTISELAVPEPKEFVWNPQDVNRLFQIQWKI